VPEIDLSDAVLSADLADSFQVIRRRQSMSQNGRVVAEPLILSMIAVVTAGSANDVDRLEDSQRSKKTLSVVTNFRLRGPTEAKGTQWLPDVVPYHGDNFIVVKVEDYTAYGSGFIQAEL
jgi:hypothetical protein